MIIYSSPYHEGEDKPKNLIPATQLHREGDAIKIHIAERENDRVLRQDI